MKRAITRTLILGSLMFGVPFMTLAAAFVGPSSQPPDGNVPGVIWNMNGVTGSQTGAKIDIDGIANFGVSGNINDVDGDIGLKNSKAFRVDYNGSAAFNMGNWYGGTSQPLTFKIYGDFTASDFGGSAGQRGRVQATQFCFNPGNPTDCLTTWPTAGSYVLKAGDSMTGMLSINGPAVGLDATGTSIGVRGYGQYGAYLEATKVGARAKCKSASCVGLEGIGNNGSNYGQIGTDIQGVLGVSTLSNGKGGEFVGGSAGIVASSTNTNSSGGIFKGIQYGVEAHAYSTGTGIIGLGGDRGGIFAGSVMGLQTSCVGTGSCVGIFGVSTSQSSPPPKVSWGKLGMYDNPNDMYVGVQGYATDTNSRAIDAMCMGTGCYGTYSQGDIGVFASGVSQGIASYSKLGPAGLFYGNDNGLEATGTKIAIAGQTSGSTGVAIKGVGGQYGGMFYGSKQGVQGNCTGSTSCVGVAGFGNRGITSGYLGYNTDILDQGVLGYTNVANGEGVHGESVLHDGVVGEGVRGVFASGTTNGVEAWNRISGNAGWLANPGSGVDGYGAGTSPGVYGQNNVGGNYGILGAGNQADGVFGQSAGTGAGVAGNGYFGVWAQGTNQGVYGTNDGGIYGYLGGNSYAVYGNGGTYGGWFNGSTMGARAYDTDGTATAYLAYIGYGLYTSNDIYVGGTAYKAGTLAWASSDKRLKDIKGDYGYGLDQIMQIDPKWFTYKKDNPLKIPSDSLSVGVIAQDMEKIMPEGVKENQGFKFVSDDVIFWAMVNSIKELNAKNEALEKRIEALENR